LCSGSSQDCDRWNREQDDNSVFDEQPQKSLQQSKVKVFSALKWRISARQSSLSLKMT